MKINTDALIDIVCFFLSVFVICLTIAGSAVAIVGGYKIIEHLISA
ncbi:hypothetical protein [Helicobacter sp. 11S02596-1]|nr:hypothetical protein [Helicobacter sp. 11S02596-1]